MVSKNKKADFLKALCVATYILSIQYGVGQIRMKSFPYLGNSFSASEFVVDIERRLSFFTGDIDDIFVAEELVPRNQWEIFISESQPACDGGCINKGSYNRIPLPQYLTLLGCETSMMNMEEFEMAFKRRILLEYRNENDVFGKSMALLGYDGTLVAFGNVDRMKSFEISEGKSVDFLYIDLEKLKSAAETCLINEKNAIGTTMHCENFEGEYVRRVSDSEYMFDWTVDVQVNGKRRTRYLLRSIIDGNLDIQIIQKLELTAPLLRIMRHKSVDAESGVRYYYAKSIETRMHNDSKTPASRSKKGGGDAGDISEPVNYMVVRFYSFIPENDSFRVEVDSVVIPRKTSIENIIPDWFGLGRGEGRFFEVKRYFSAVSDSLTCNFSHFRDFPTSNGVQWRDWSFLGSPILSEQKGSIGGTVRDVPISETTFEVIRHSSLKSDTVRVKLPNPLLFNDYCVTRDGHLHILGQSRFFISDFGTPTHRMLESRIPDLFDSSQHYKFASYNGSNPDIVTYSTHIDIPMNGDMSIEQFSGVTSCDISDFKANSSQFIAILKSGDEVIGNLEIGLYETNKLMPESPTKNVYCILIAGYAFKYDQLAETIMIQDGSIFGKVKSFNQAIDLVVRIFLSLNNDMKYSNPICHD